LSTFLTNALASPKRTSKNSTGNTFETPLPTWYFTSAFASQNAYEAFDKLLHPFSQFAQNLSSSRGWSLEVGPEADSENFAYTFDFATIYFGDQWALQELSEAVNQFDTITDGNLSRSTDAKFVAVSSFPNQSPE
jgi:pre-rRNA-processing protein IPI1